MSIAQIDLHAGVRVVEVAAASDAYDAFLAGRPEALFYASNGYRSILRDLLGATDRYFAATDEAGRVEAVLPAFLSKPGDGGPVLNSLPFYGSNGGVVGEFDPTTASPLLERFYETAREAGCASATFITSPFDSERQVSWYADNCRPDARDERIGQVTFLPDSADELPAFVEGSCHLMVRRAIKKAQRSGIEVRATGREGLSFLKQVHEENMQAIGGIAKPQRFFDLFPDLVETPRDYRVFTAFREGEPVAALLLFYFNKTVEYFTPVIRANARTFQPLSLVIFEAMADAIRRGSRRWNWGGTWLTQGGVYDFKARWGARDLRYRYFTRLYDTSLLRRSRQDILEQYPNFYVLPFDMLAS
jgi:hypothetical protein